MDYFYNEPRFRMSYLGRFGVRFLTYAGGALLLAVGLVFSLSDIIQLRGVAIVIGIIALYFLVRLGKPRRSLLIATHPNIAHYLAPEAYRKIEVALDRTALDHSDFTLNLFGDLVGATKASQEFVSKVHSRRKRLSRRQTKAETTVIINDLMVVAFAEARSAGADAIRSPHLLKALLIIESPEVVKTFEIFGLKPGDGLY